MLPEAESRVGSYGSVNVMLPLLEYLENAGFEVKAVLDNVGISKAVLEQTKARFPKGKFRELWRIARAATGDPAIALRVSTMAKTNTLGIIGYLAAACESRRTAFEHVKNLTALLWEDVECDLESDREVVFLRCRTGGHSPANRFTTEYAVGLMVTMSRAFGAGHFDPLEARFSYPAPAYADDYERILRLPVRFGAGADGVLFPNSMMDSLNPSADAALRQLLERYAAEQLAKIRTSGGLSQSVRACIRSVLPSGPLTADVVASRLRMSERTLRRRLREEATSYQIVLDDVRAALARHYLTREKRGINEVGFLLGFSDQSAFTKAFRRWTGRTPANFVRANSS